MNFKEDFEYYLTKEFDAANVSNSFLVEQIVRHIEVNYIIPLRSECFTLQQELNKIKKQSKNLQS